jgi:hypothetical protein
MTEPTPPLERAETYWGQARRPLAALLFLLPLLAVYEFGVLALGGGDAALRNGADFWMRGWLFSAGLQHPWLLPVVVIGLLGAWHLWERHPWKCSLETLIGMFAESLLFALALVIVGQLLHVGFECASLTTLSLPTVATGPGAARAVGFVGAGIYEEVLFRLGLLPLCYMALRPCTPRWFALAAAVGATSLIFSAAHYVQPAEQEWWITAFPEAVDRVVATPANWFSFAFRTLAGVVFSLLFLRRGFGVTVGCHALYDLLVGVVMQQQGD